MEKKCAAKANELIETQSNVDTQEACKKLCIDSTTCTFASYGSDVKKCSLYSVEDCEESTGSKFITFKKGTIFEIFKSIQMNQVNPVLNNPFTDLHGIRSIEN